MNGHVVVPKLIAVDFWKENEVPYFFLTHCHGDHVSPKLWRWSEKIYTSKLNCEILRLMYDIPRRLLVELPLGQTTAIGEFQVTALDARHCPGSIALLFQGEFGTVLYSGDLRYWPGLPEEPALQYVLQSGGGIDRLYLDNTYCSPECVFPRRKDVLEQVIRYLRECGDCDIYIGMRDLGKEDAVLAIAEALQARVHVSKSRLRMLERCAPSPRWTTDEAASRIRLVPFRRIAEYGAGGTSPSRPRVALLLTALFVGSQLPAPYSGGRVQVFPYSDHSSFPELCELVRLVRPRQVLPLIKRWAMRGWPAHRDLSARVDMSVFRTYLLVDSPPRHAALLTDRPATRPDVARDPAPETEGGGRGGESPAERSAEGGAGVGEEQAAVPAAGPMNGVGGGPSGAVAVPAEVGVGRRPVAAGAGAETEANAEVEAEGEAEAEEGTWEERPCPFLVVSGRLERLERVLYTQQQVTQWLSSSPGTGGTQRVVCGEVSSSCD